MIEKTIYICDVHGTKYFKDFVNEYNNGKTHFISLGDLFDRGDNSYEIFLEIEKLHGKGLYDMVLGNHDLFFILGIGFSEKYNGFLLNRLPENIKNNDKIYNLYKKLGENNMNLMLLNGGDKTLNSICEIFKSYDGYNVSKLNKEEQIERLNYIAAFLWDNFDLYKVDHFNNLLIHGGLPILKDGSIVNVKIDGNMTNGGLDLLKKINNKFKSLDLDILEWLSMGESREYNHYNIISNLMAHNLINDKEIVNDVRYRLDTSKDLTLTWFDNSSYYNKERLKSLKKELKDNKLNSLICGHWHNAIDKELFNGIDTEYWQLFANQPNTLYRLDRSFFKVKKNYGNFGVLILDKEGKAIDIFDYLIRKNN